MNVARAKVGPDAHANQDGIFLRPGSNAVFIQVRGESVAASKVFSLRVSGPDSSHVSSPFVLRADAPWTNEPRQPLWRSDESWIELLRRAWLKERPNTRSICVLHERSETNGRYWLLTFNSYITDDLRRIPGRAYRLRNGDLEIGPWG